jgi:hypothetical protein
VAAPPETLEALVRDELRGPVSELVRRVVVELVREQLNGAASVVAEAPQSTNGATPSTKTCRACGIEKPADQFAPNRRVCKPCRREQGRGWEEGRVARRREQRTASETEPPCSSSDAFAV